IINHLYKNQIYGTYVSNKESQTKFLVFDFDDVADLGFIKNLYKICKINNIYAYLELSSSKTGYHLWIFFDDFIANNIVRKFAILLLSLTLNISKNIDFKYFDRIFPTQDFLSKQELGNLIRLPLSYSDVSRNACVFLNENFEIEKNQIDFLYKIKENNSKYICAFLNDNFKNSISFALNNSIKNSMDKLIFNSDKLNILVTSEIIFDTNQLEPSLLKWLIFISSFINVNYIKLQRMRISVWNVPYIISTYRIENGKIYLPKGLLNEIISKLKQQGIKYKLKNKTTSGKAIDITTNFELNNIQKNYFYELIKHNTGVLIAPTGFGKTMIGINLIKEFSKNTLIVVDRKIIAEHWKAMIIKYTNISEDEIDLNKQKKNKIMFRTYQSINNDSKLDQFKDVGLTIVDEWHHSAAYKYENVIKKIKSKNLYGLTATFKRYDNLEKIVSFLFGNIIEVDNSMIEIKSQKLLKIIPTNFSVLHSKNKNISEIHKYLIEDESRNKLICKLLENLYKKNKKVLVLSEWVSHIENIYLEINKKISNTIMLHGQMNKKELKSELNKAEIDIPKIILATGKFLGEGYDLKSIDTIVNIFPFIVLKVNWNNTWEE
ncbi:MAG: DEAD/DEAH box helicase family protein, partial [Malacoplasma sp.]|nr:DEAD/DEAH box helicase family protein [Malacoplasma sp.]